MQISILISWLAAMAKMIVHVLLSPPIFNIYSSKINNLRNIWDSAVYVSPQTSLKADDSSDFSWVTHRSQSYVPEENLICRSYTPFIPQGCRTLGSGGFHLHCSNVVKSKNKQTNTKISAGIAVNNNLYHWQENIWIPSTRVILLWDSLRLNLGIYCMPKSSNRRWTVIKTRQVWSHCEVFATSDFSRWLDHAEPLILLLVIPKLERSSITTDGTCNWRKLHSMNVVERKTF